MINLFKDEAKINLCAKFQKLLCNLTTNSTDADVDKVFELLPPNYLTDRDNLFMICQLIGNFARNHVYGPNHYQII